MKNIIVLVDFSEGCKIALQQALVIAKQSGAKMIALNIQKEGHSDNQVFDKLKTFTMSAIGYQENVTALVHEGSIFQTIADVIMDLNPNLVVFCTHGIRGLAQTLFGGHALKLVQALPYPCLVVQENTRVNENGFSKVLFAVSPFPDIHFKAAHTAQLAKVFKATVVIYEIEKYMADTEELIAKNKQDIKNYFQAQGLQYTEANEDIKQRSLGYARQTLRYAYDHKVDLLTMVSELQNEDLILLKANKESMIANEEGIPVLCCPSTSVEKHYTL